MKKSKLVQANDRIAQAVAGSYKKVEEGVVGGYQKMENGVVTGYNKIADHFIEHFFAEDGESVEEAKARLAGGGKK